MVSTISMRDRDEMIDKMINHMSVDELAEFVHEHRLLLIGRARKILEYMDDYDFRIEYEDIVGKFHDN